MYKFTGIAMATGNISLSRNSFLRWNSFLRNPQSWTLNCWWDQIEARKGLTAKLNTKTGPVLPSPVCLTGFFFCYFHGFLAIFISSSNNNSTSYTIVPVLYSLLSSLIFHFPLLPSPVHPTGFSFYILSDFFAIFILLSPNNNNKAREI